MGPWRSIGLLWALGLLQSPWSRWAFVLLGLLGLWAIGGPLGSWRALRLLEGPWALVDFSASA
jgi:hypothetical protein